MTFGVGKTAQALAALPDYKPKAIVISPTAVALSWEGEARRVRPDVRFTILEPSDPFRAPGENEIIWRSWGSQPESIDVPLNDVFLIGDEIHSAKSDDAQRSVRFRRLRNKCGSCWGLTATPMLGDPEDLWGVLLSLGLTGIFDHSKEKFVELCGGSPRFIWDRRMNRGRGGRRRVGYNWGNVSPLVKEMLKDVMLRRLADDVLDDLPETQEIDVPVPAPDDLRPMLDEVKRKAWENIDQDDLPPFERLSEAMAALARAKTKHFVELTDMRASKTMPILAFSAHRDPVIAVGKLKGAACITGDENMKERRKAIDAFQAGKLRILALTIATGGAGLNLQKAGGVIFCDRDYTPGMNGQALGRARRQGNVRSRVICWRLICDHVLDRHLAQILDTKSRLISQTVD